jgi:phosphohistidine phosphatase SixA
LILEKELIPQTILSSSALRARLTVDAISESMGFNGEVEYLDAFYMAEPGAYLEKLRMLPEDVERVMIIGHNPRFGRTGPNPQSPGGIAVYQCDRPSRLKYQELDRVE